MVMIWVCCIEMFCVVLANFLVDASAWGERCDRVM